MKKNLIFNFLLCLFFCQILFINLKISAQVVCTELPDPFAFSKTKSRTAGITSKFWKTGQTITIKFLAGNEFLRNKVKQFSVEWLQYANLKFQFVADNSPAMIRIDFQQGRGSYSYLGTDNLLIAANQHAMNFGWFNDKTPDKEFSRVVIHEFGHMLGLIHEQSHPDVEIPWNKEAVYAYYAKMGWDRKKVDSAIFQRYNHQTTQYNEYDKTSIMHYSVAKEFTYNNFEVGSNTVLSEADKKFIATVYPKNSTNTNTNVNNNNNNLIVNPSSLAADWYGLPFSRIDAVINYPNDIIYLFRGDKYVKWDYNDDTDLIPRSIKGNWKGVNFDKIDDAFYWEANQKIYFFSGDLYTRYDIKREETDPTYPRKIKDEWNGLSVFPRIDAILPWKDKVYFFYGNQYLRYDFKADKVDAGYPKTINRKTWKGLSFDKIDAVAVWEFPTVYFISGGKYHRYDMEKDEAY